MVIMPLGLSEKSNEAWSLPRLTQQFVRWLFSLFDFLDIVMLLEILLIQMKCLKKRKCGFCGSCDTGAFWCQPCRKLKKGFITIKQEDKEYIKHYICYFTYAYVETTINARSSCCLRTPRLPAGCRTHAQHCSVPAAVTGQTTRGF